MSDPVDFDAHRWMKGGGCNDFKPVEALRAAIRAIESGELQARHVIIVVAAPKNTHIFTAGELDYLGRVGLAARGHHIMQED